MIHHRHCRQRESFFVMRPGHAVFLAHAHCLNLEFFIHREGIPHAFLGQTTTFMNTDDTLDYDLL